MCFECRILGALINGGRPDSKRFKLHEQGVDQFDFSPSIVEVENKDLRDHEAEEYLSETLAKLQENFGVELVPVKVDSDGSCLPHAVSRCLAGKEIFYDVLRLELEHELRDHTEFYRGILGAGMDDETFQNYWDAIIEEARPVYGGLTGRWLGPEHILGLANVLKRPILLLDVPEFMEKDDNRCGMYLPLRHSRADCISDHGSGEVGTPLVIGWASAARNHFVSLVRPSRNRLLASEEEEWTNRARSAAPELWKDIDDLVDAMRSRSTAEQVEIVIPLDKTPGDVCVLQDPESGEEILVQIPPGKGPGDTFMWNPDVENGITRLYSALVHFFATNPPVIRDQSRKTLYTVLKNLVDAILVDHDKLLQRSKLRTNNKIVKRTITSVSSAVDILRAVGFSDFVDPASGDSFLNFEGDLTKPESCDALVLARDVLARMQGNNSVVQGAGQINMPQTEAAFGLIPAFCKRDKNGEPMLSWEHYREYALGFDTEKPDLGAWVFGLGNPLRLSQMRLITSLMSSLKDRFVNLTRNTEYEDVAWDDEMLYASRLAHVKCPNCRMDQTWVGEIDGFRAESRTQECENCNETLDVSLTDQRCIAAFVHNALSDSKGTLWCEKHEELRLSSLQPDCPRCKCASE